MDFENLFEIASESQPQMDEGVIEETIVNPMAQGLPEGYWFSEKREDEGGNLVYEFITTNGPTIMIHVVTNA
jgi:hypothetical protein